MESHHEELKALEEKGKEIQHNLFNLKVQLAFNAKRIKLIKEEMEALKPMEK